MREGWKYERLGEICEFISGYTPSKELLNENEGFPYFKVSDMNTLGNEKYLTYTTLYIPLPKKIVPKGSIVFPKNGGAIYTNKKRILFQDSVVDLNTEAIVPNNDIITAEFLYKLFLFIDLGQFDNGGGLPSINIKKMKEFILSIPSLEEQRQIVEKLDLEFAKIDAIKQNAEKQLQWAKDLFQSALKDLLTPKEGWECSKFGDVCEYYKEQGKWVDINYIGLENIDAHTGKLIDYKSANEVESSTFKFNKGDVLYGRLRPYLQKVIIAPFDGCCSTEIFPIKSNVINNVYLKYWLLSDDVMDIMNASCSGCRMPRANMNDFKKEHIQYPSKQEQIIIANKLENLQNMIGKLQSNYEQMVVLCNDLKQSLLKDIFG